MCMMMLCVCVGRSWHQPTSASYLLCARVHTLYQNHCSLYTVLAPRAGIIVGQAECLGWGTNDAITLCSSIGDQPPQPLHVINCN
jgi:hypothetical protein